MNLAFLGAPAKLVTYLKTNSVTEEEIFLPVDGVSWGSGYQWMVGHDHPELDDFLREVKFGKPLRLWTITVMTPDTEARLIEALDQNSNFGKDFVVHSEQQMTLHRTIIGRVRYVNRLLQSNRRRRPWAFGSWPVKLEELARHRR